MLTWTIGSGGLLGGAVDRQSARSFAASAIPWSDPERSIATLGRELARFREEAGSGEWALIWAAGHATTATGSAVAAVERQVFTSFLSLLVGCAPAGDGAFFLTSSAGGVYAGSPAPPYDVRTPIRPISPYGDLKAAQEQDALVLADTCPVVIGRISNVYGPGQNLRKVQGLVTRLVLAAATRQPINIFVPLSTLRDYVFVDDAARAVHAWTRHAIEATAPQETCIVASGESTAISHLIRTVQDVSGRRVPVALGSHASAQSQALDLRFVPTPVPGGRHRAPTTLPVGTRLVFDDVLRRLQASGTGL